MNNEEELKSLFQAERAVRPPPQAVEHGLRRLSLDLAGQVAPPPIGMGPLKLGVSAIPKWLASGFVLGLLGASAALPPFAPSSPAGPHAPPAQPSAAPPAPQPAPVSPQTEPEVAQVLPKRDAPSGALPTLGAPAASSAPSASFDAELKLISFAKSELDARRPARAHAWLSEHAQRFPHGVFAVEREALFALSACQQLPPNVALAERFAQQHPNSPLSARLEHSCALNMDTKRLNGTAAPGERMIEPNAGEKR